MDEVTSNSKNELMLILVYYSELPLNCLTECYKIYRKIPKISPFMYKLAPQTHNTKNTPLNISPQGLIRENYPQIQNKQYNNTKNYLPPTIS